MKEEIVDELAKDAQVPRIGKNFRSSPDIENFYRFIHEYSLRNEAHLMFQKVLKIIKKSKQKKSKIRQ